MSDLAVGLMSGTSLDGIDAALVRIDGRDDVSLDTFYTEPFDGRVRRAIVDAMEGGSPRALALLHVQLGERFAAAVLQLLDAASISPEQVSFVASHGLTVWHEPRRASLQLGDPAIIAERVGVQVVSDFRSRDIAAGGEGAPLVPIADVLLFGHHERGRVLLNLGGMANVTWVPRRGATEGVIAFDTGPGVAVLDAVVRRETGAAFDMDGDLAARGEPAEEVVERLLEGDYFRRPPPKSTGREMFGEPFAERLIEQVRSVCDRATSEDCIATAVALTVHSVSAALERWTPGGRDGDVVISGGGARNVTLMAQLHARLDGWCVRSFQELFFDGDAKEAVAFAYLGWLTLRGEPGNVPSATGAGGRRLLGRVTPA